MARAQQVSACRCAGDWGTRARRRGLTGAPLAAQRGQLSEHLTVSSGESTAARQRPRFDQFRAPGRPWESVEPRSPRRSAGLRGGAWLALRPPGPLARRPAAAYLAEEATTEAADCARCRSPPGSCASAAPGPAPPRPPLGSRGLRGPGRRAPRAGPHVTRTPTADWRAGGAAGAAALGDQAPGGGYLATQSLLGRLDSWSLW